MGDRTGLAGAKSSLFYQAIRIIQEMRDATGDQFPIIAVWENVIYALKHITDVMCRKQLCKAPPKNAEKQHHQALFLCT